MHNYMKIDVVDHADHVDVVKEQQPGTVAVHSWSEENYIVYSL